MWLFRNSRGRSPPKSALYALYLIWTEIKTSHSSLDNGETQATHIKYYAHFLAETRQGKNITGISADLDAVTIDAIAEATLDAWEPRLNTQESI